ncbi:hypothetical protein WS7_20838, partial [Xanthomonas citri pv. malvacearum str. GSPB2388]
MCVLRVRTILVIRHVLTCDIRIKRNSAAIAGTILLISNELSFFQLELILSLGERRARGVARSSVIAAVAEIQRVSTHLSLQLPIIAANVGSLAPIPRHAIATLLQMQAQIVAQVAFLGIRRVLPR